MDIDSDFISGHTADIFQRYQNYLARRCLSVRNAVNTYISLIARYKCCSGQLQLRIHSFSLFVVHHGVDYYNDHNREAERRFDRCFGAIGGVRNVVWNKGPEQESNNQKDLNSGGRSSNSPNRLPFGLLILPLLIVVVIINTLLLCHRLESLARWWSNRNTKSLNVAVGVCWDMITLRGR